MSAMHHQPDGPAFDVVLLLHVGCVVVGLASVVTSAATAARLRKLLNAASSLPDAVVRYFHPGVNWVGRTLYGIPIFGFALLALSHGAYGLADGWVTSGLMIFVVVIAVGESTLWPAERRLQVSLASQPGGDPPVAPSVMHDVNVMALSATVALVLLIAGSALMVAQP